MRVESSNRCAPSPTGTTEYAFRTGKLELKVDRVDAENLFILAERQNPKRAFLFVSTVLGRHIPVTPSNHRDALWALTEKTQTLLLDGPIFVMGYAETAVGIGAGIFDCLRQKLPERKIGYLHTTRHVMNDAIPWFTIVEGHSHAQDHNIMRPDESYCESGQQSTLVLVDDETTTGNTFAQLAEGLYVQGARFGRIILVTLTDWSDDRARARVEAVTSGTKTVAVSLMSGSWIWKQDESAKLPNLPAVAAAMCPPWEPDSCSSFSSPRNGLKGGEMSDGAHLLSTLPVPPIGDRDKRILVIGTGEHVWQPFLYAEAVEQVSPETRQVGFIATTRSPILSGPAIEHKITFPDHFGIGLDMYLHNVEPDDWDRIVLFTETTIEGVHPILRRALGKGHIVDKDGQVFEMMNI